MTATLARWFGWWPVVATRDPEFPYLSAVTRWEEPTQWGEPMTHTLHVARLAQLERLRREVPRA